MSDKSEEPRRDRRPEPEPRAGQTPETVPQELSYEAAQRLRARLARKYH